MKILLVNPNTFQHPPVPPLGLEYVISLLREAGHAAETVDLCFSDDPRGDLARKVRDAKPELVGLTIRNVDTVLYHTNEFFLDEVKMIVGDLRRVQGIKVLLGGAGLRADPEGILGFVGADFAYVGPAEAGLLEFLRQIEAGSGAGKIFVAGTVKELSCRRDIGSTSYHEYLQGGALPGIETHKGCSSSCVYCMEADTPVTFRNTCDVVEEVRALADRGCDRFHLCDPEFNEDLDYSIAVCEALKRAGVPMSWIAYMKPANFSHKLLRLMKATGTSLVTLSVDSFRKCPLYLSDIEKMVFMARSQGIPLVVDFLAGFPTETEDDLRTWLDFFRRIQAERVNVNTYIRLYRSLRISKIVMNDARWKSFLIGEPDTPSLVRPVFFNQISSARLAELISGDEIFRIEGLEQGVNYERIPTRS